MLRVEFKGGSECDECADGDLHKCMLYGDGDCEDCGDCNDRDFGPYGDKDCNDDVFSTISNSRATPRRDYSF